MISMVVAYDKHRVIGGNNTLPWAGAMPADMRHFKALTVGKSVIMGRSTYESIGRPLPDRQNIVLSRGAFAAEGVEVVRSIAEAYASARHDVVIIGGGQVFAATLGDADSIYATEIAAEFDGDVFFPPLGREWVETARESHAADAKNRFAYSFVTYTKQR